MSSDYQHELDRLDCEISLLDLLKKMRECGLDPYKHLKSLVDASTDTDRLLEEITDRVSAMDLFLRVSG